MIQFDPEKIRGVIRDEIARYQSKIDVRQVGTVLEVGDGIAHVSGLSDAMAGEMLEFEGGVMGQAFNLEESTIGVVIYGSCERVREGDVVRGTGRLAEVPVGRAMIGRVVDSAGRPLDGRGPIETDQTRPVEIIAPGIAERQPVNEPLPTGLKSIDAITPIGRGQRELIIGDRKTGKTAIALDTIINQKGTGVVCVYVAIGQKESTVAGVVEMLRSRGAMEHTVVVSAASSDPAPVQYVAPYAGCAIAEHFMYNEGRATLVVYDDLTKQAAAYRQICLLLRRPPGREAYPGDVFYLHSRLLERACKLADHWVIVPADTPESVQDIRGVDGEVYVGPLGKEQAQRERARRPEAETLKVHRLPLSGGSMTALPICETQEGEVAAYIPTNLISITDGQIYLEPSLFFAGVRPAVNVGISVSRVGYKASYPAMKQVAKGLRLDLAAYRELESFSQIGMELDDATQRQLDRGARMVRVLVQGQFEPMAVMDQVIEIFAGAEGFLDDLPVAEVSFFERGLLEYIKDACAETYELMAASNDLEGHERSLRRFIREYKETVYEQQRRARRRAVRERAQP
jgi:F-type H+-transporting ATPase subunit alpha